MEAYLVNYNGFYMVFGEQGKIIPFTSSAHDREAIIVELKQRCFRVFVQEWVQV